MREPKILRDADQARAFLSRIIDPTIGCAEIRILDCDFNKKSGLIFPEDQFKKTISGWFDDVDKAVFELGRLHGVSPFVTINPIKPAYRAKAYNRLKIAGKNGSTPDKDIVCLRWLFVDVDPIRPSNISSTDDELAAAVDRRDRVLAENPELRRSALWGLSGNGAWILIRLPDYANDEAHHAIIERALGYLSDRYSDDVVKIDTTTKNPSRIMGIPGCLKAKGDPIPDRPFRAATINPMETAAQ